MSFEFFVENSAYMSNAIKHNYLLVTFTLSVQIFGIDFSSFRLKFFQNLIDRFRSLLKNQEPVLSFQFRVQIQFEVERAIEHYQNVNSKNIQKDSFKVNEEAGKRNK
ncbi:Hypothetical_protein [Hexamita inflata]|uniref:Hypothetical_protein n=1 Tax=Hexamita inflata TaxID=28002 RepID=A0AA86PG83_9EUKA|nr:Hypothetical protein HINF_LOCUS25723 [Hexamita inflata]